MLETRFLISATRLETAELRGALPRLAAKGWTPALLEAERAFLRAAGLSEWPAAGAPTLRGVLPSRQSDLRKAIACEVFFRGPDCCYVITKPEGRALWKPPATASEASEPEVEVGVISTEGRGIGERLREFAEVLRAACSAGRGADIPVEWRADMPSAPRLAAILAADEASPRPSLSPPRMGLVEMDYGRLLAAPLLRQILKDLHRAGFAREQDLMFLAKADPETLRGAMEELKQAGLIEVEYLLECRQDRRPLIRAKTRRQLEAPEVGQLVCPICRNPFSAEALSTVFSVAETARGIGAHSRWLRIWLTEQLTQSGVPLAALLWRGSEAGEHAELLGEFLGQLWLFAVKDSDFSADEGYALNYRRVRCRADRLVLLTTGAVANETKRLLDEAAGDGDGGGSEPPLYIEGLENAKGALEQVFSAAALSYAHRRLLPIEEVSGFDLGGLLALRLRGLEGSRNPLPFTSVPRLAVQAGG